MDFEPHITSYVGLDLLAWRQQSVLILSPKFQRRGVWSSAARSYFIDTLLRGYPVPPLHIRLIKDPKRGLMREVVDGQQRLRALFEFIEGKYRLSRQLKDEWAGKSFDQLPQEARDKLLESRFSVYQYQNINDATVLEIFSRINTYSVPLNAQELRNGKFFGPFKQAVYALALRHYEFWSNSRLFTDGAIARMREAELVSELLVLQMDGLQDKKSSIDDFYKRLDEGWDDTPTPWDGKGRAVPRQWLSRAESELRVDSILDTIDATVGDLVAGSEFRRIPLFYSLYSIFYHHMYGLPGFERHTTMRIPDPEAIIKLRSIMEVVSDLVSEKPKADEVHGWRHDFLVASSGQTDNIAPRRTRLEVLWDQAELGTA